MGGRESLKKFRTSIWLKFLVFLKKIYALGFWLNEILRCLKRIKTKFLKLYWRCHWNILVLCLTLLRYLLDKHQEREREGSVAVSLKVSISKAPPLHVPTLTRDCLDANTPSDSKHKSIYRVSRPILDTSCCLKF